MSRNGLYSGAIRNGDMLAFSVISWKANWEYSRTVGFRTGQSIYFAQNACRAVCSSRWMLNNRSSRVISKTSRMSGLILHMTSLPPAC